MSLELQQKKIFITDTNYFNILSNELINIIFYFLEPHEIVKLSQTNRAFRDIITDKDNLLLLYKNFKKIYSFWKQFPNIDIALEKDINTHSFKGIE